MSIYLNGKKIAGSYKIETVSEATDEKSGIIRIATEEEVSLGESKNTAITPFQLANASSKTLVDNETIIKGEDNTITSIGVKSKSNDILYDWVGTEEEYEAGIKDGSISLDWICWITDDNEIGGSNGGVSLPLLTPIFVDHVLSYEESQGYGRCGEYIYATAIAGERYGYPDLIKDLIAEYNSGVTTTVTQGTKSVACRKSASGHYLYDIANQADVDAMFDETGVVWMYGVDIENNRIMLPKINKYFGLVNSAQLVGTYGKPGVPNIIGDIIAGENVGLVSQNATLTGPFEMGTVDKKYVNSGGSGWRDLKFNFSKVSPVYNESDTVQVGRANMLCYLVVGNTQQDTSWIDVVTDVNGAVKDVVDAGDEQVERINTVAQSYDNLTYRNVSNCLLEVPQRIKCELTDGSLTIKAGSIVIVPYGIVDKTREFPVGSDFLNSNFKVVDCEYIRGKFTVWVELQTDLIHLPVGTYTGNGMMAINFTNNMVVQSGPLANCRSGESDSQNGSDGFYFNTTNYTITSYRDNGTIVDQNICLPFVQIHRTSGAWDNIEQVFNGMGCIGSVFWVDKEVKGLASNYRNSNGTLNNVKVNSSELQIYDNTESTWSTTNVGYVLMSNNELQRRTQSSYNATKNINVNMNGVEEVFCKLANCTVVNGKITILNPVLPFRVDASSIIETYRNGASGYRLYSDGWCEQYYQSNTTKVITFLKPFIDANYSVSVAQTNLGSNMQQYYNSVFFSNKSASSIKINSGESENPMFSFTVCGYVQ